MAQIAAGTWDLRQRCGGEFGYALDAAYLDLASARSLAESGSWGLVPGDFILGERSPLWVLLLALGTLLGQGFVSPLVIGTLAILAGVAISGWLLERLGLPVLARLGALVALVLALPAPALVLGGTAHALFAVGTLALLAATVHFVRAAAGGGLLVLVTGLLPLIHPDGLLAVLAMLAAARPARRIALACVLAATGPCSIWGLAGGSGAFVWLSWPWLSWPLDLGTQSGPAAVALGGMLAAVLALLAERSLSHSARVSGVFFGVLCGLALLGIRGPATFEAGLIGVGVVVSSALIWACWQVHEAWGSRLALGGLLLLLGIGVADRAWQIHQALPARVSATRQGPIRAAQFLQAHFRGVPVAVSTVGALQYAGGRGLDLSGQAHPQMARLVSQGAIAPAALGALLDREEVALLVLWQPIGGPPGARWAADPAIPADWHPVAAWAQPGAGQVLRFLAREAEIAAQLRTHLAAFQPQLAPGTELQIRQPHTVPLSQIAVGKGLAEHGPDQLLLVTNGWITIPVDVPGTLHIVASGSLVDAVGPQLRLLRNGSPWGPAWSIGVTPHTLSPGTVEVGDQIELHYENDALGPDGADRNLFIRGVEILPLP